MKKRTFTLHGYEVQLFDFGYKSFFYPSFNGNAEFEATREGFRELRHYLRTVLWIKNGMTMDERAQLYFLNQLQTI